jgi:hypothetical protein
MKIKVQAITLAATLAISAAAFAAVQGFSIKHTAKEGTTYKYDMTGSVNVPSVGADATIKALVEEKTTKAGAEGFTNEENQLSGTLTINGQDMELPAQTITTVYSADGRILSITGGDNPADSIRTANLGVLIDPGKSVAVGDKWTAEIKEDTAKNIVPVKADYEVLGEEKIGTVDTLKIKATLAETSGSTPASSISTMWVDKSDGSRVKVESEWKDFPSQFGPMNATITMTRVP